MKTIGDNRILKRIFDLLLAIPITILGLPVIGLLGFAVWVKLGLPVFYCQKRPGLHGKLFTVYKLRTMTLACDEKGSLLPDADRLTAFGRILRGTSIDELPELFNIIRGEMSLVGPRPLLTEYLTRYDSQQARRHNVKPGITGLTQISGRNAISWEDKFRYDIWYVDNWTLWLDIKILCRTLVKVIKREGINHPGQATMPLFRGSDLNNSHGFTFL